jgi:two-component system, OmpR family, sensor histidine kinase ArlS
MKKKTEGCKKLSTAARIAFQFSLLLAAVILAMSISIVLLLRSDVRMRQNKELAAAMEQIAEDMTEKNENGNATAEGKILGMGLPYYIVFTVYADDGDEVIETNDPFLPQLPLTNGRSVRYRRTGYFIDGDLNILYCAKKYSYQNSSTFIVQAALNMDRDTSEQLILRLPRMLLIVFAPLLLISFWVALFMARKVLRPVGQMTFAARRISSANLDQRLPVTGRGDELDTLALTFNELFSRLKNEFDRERQFTANVSHELKTPLAVIFGQTSLLRRWGKNDPVQLDKSLAALMSESETMETIIANMLLLSRLESGAAKPNCVRVELAPLFARLEKDTHGWASDALFEVTMSDSSVTVLADEELLYQVCTIIVSNSIKFSPHPAQLKIAIDTIIDSAQQNDVAVRITFTDNGPGIAQNVLPHVFDRFYRGDVSHNRKSGGAGLGLSIAKEIMSVMGGSIEASSHDGADGNRSEHGAVVTLTLLMA